MNADCVHISKYERVAKNLKVVSESRVPAEREIAYPEREFVFVESGVACGRKQYLSPQKPNLSPSGERSCLPVSEMSLQSQLKLGEVVEGSSVHPRS